MLKGESLPSWFDVPYPSNQLDMQQIMLPRGFSTNFVLLIWAFVGSFLVYAFLANFLGMLIKPMKDKPIDTAQDVLDKGMIPITPWAGEYYVDLLKNSPNPVYQQLAKRVVVPKDMEEMTSLVIEGVQGTNTHVFISQYLCCGMGEVGIYYGSKEIVSGSTPWYIWIVNKKWPLKDNLAHHILIYQQVSNIFFVVSKY